jgi:hypothetical protein
LYRYQVKNQTPTGRIHASTNKSQDNNAMTLKLEKNETGLLIAILILIFAAVFGPAVIQPAHHHDFADHRIWGSLPFAADVLSNLPFALWGIYGLICLYLAATNANISKHTKVCVALFFAGLLITAAASTRYHLQPNDAGLAVDRLGMTVAFSGLLGLAAADRASLRAGALLSLLVLVLGPLSVWVWSSSGNVLPWLVLQFGGMVLVLWLATRQPIQGALAVRWGAVILIYAAAKVLELADHAVYDFTSQLISGHSLKHIVASFAAWPVSAALITKQKVASQRLKLHYTQTHNH